jgi:hypothetical protein
MPHHARIDPADVRRCHADGMRDAAIGRLLGCTARYVCQVRARLGLPNSHGRNKAWTTADTERLQRLHAAGHTLPDIAESLGRTTLSVRDRIRKLQGKKL